MRKAAFCLPFLAALATGLPARTQSASVTWTLALIEGGQTPWGKSLADVDGDGFLDVVVSTAWYRYPAWTKYAVDFRGGNDLQAGDVNGDGAVDFVGNSGGIFWSENPRGTGGNPQNPWAVRTIDGTNTGSHDLAVGDVNGDGRLDVVSRGEFGPTYLYLQDTPTSWTKVHLSQAPDGEGTALADINRDGRVDVVGNGYWLQQPSDPVNGTWTRRNFAAWGNGSAVAVADINRDGRLDVFLSASEIGTGTLSWFEAPADPVAGTWIKRDVATVTDVHRFHLADIDRDGDLDIAFAEMHQSSTRRVGVYYNGGNGGSWTLQTIATTGAHNIAVGDVGNDGDTDIMGANWNTGAPDGGGIKLWRNDLNPGSAPYKVLVFSKTLGFRHASIPTGIAAIQSLGQANGFTADATEDSNAFTDANLAQYRAAIFLNPSGDILDANQRGAFQRFIQGGKGFVGVHNAAAYVLENWPWYTDLVGARFASETSGNLRLRIVDRNHPSTATLPDPWTITEEVYNFDRNPRTIGATVLVNLDETSISGGTMGADHPTSWYHNYDGGRSWYTFLGAGDATYSDANFRAHLLGAIQWASAVAGTPAPAAPSGLTAAAASSTQINLAWTDASSNETGFRIERKTGAGGTYAEIATVGAGVTSFGNSGLTGGTTYFYRVRAYNAGGNSATSNEASATTPSSLPSVGVGGSDLAAAEPGGNTAILVFTRSGGNTGAGLTVNYAVTGTATPGSDYTALPGSVAFAAGQTSVSVTVTALDDSAVEPQETVVVTISASAAYSIGTGTATVTIADDDSAPPPDQDPVVAFTRPANGAMLSGTAAVNARANDPDAGTADGAGIQSVVFELRQGTGVVATLPEFLVTYDWNLDTTLYPNGAYTLRATATSTAAAGGTSSQANLSVTIANGGGGLPAPWQSQDVGSVGVPGTASHAAGVFTVEGSGADVWGAADAFRFVYRPLSGDGEIIARVTTLENTDPWAKAGVMLRETLQPGSIYAMMAATPANGPSFQRRPTTGGSSFSTSGGGAAAPLWVRITRVGNSLSGYTSPDGLSWTLTGTDAIPMAADVLVGLAVTAHDNATLATATFDGVMAVAGTDADGDGLPDAFEVLYGLDPGSADQDGSGLPDGLDDWNGNGITNSDEAGAGADPGTPPGGGAGVSGGGGGGGCGATGLEPLLLALALRRRRQRPSRRS